MILLDTNVVSEPLKLRPDAAVVRWLDQQHPQSLYLPAPALAELLLGIDLLPPGQRKNELSSRFAALLAKLFEDRILGFDQAAAIVYARIMANTQRQGRMLGIVDAQIAAIAASRGFFVASRDGQPYRWAEVPLIDPWNPDGAVTP